MLPEKQKCVIEEFNPKDYNKIIDSLDYFMALILQNNPDADIITVHNFVQLIKTNYYTKWWKINEFELHLVRIFNEMYQLIDPIRNNWPKIRDNYSDLTTNIRQTLQTDGSQQDCDPSEIINIEAISDIAIKKYIVAILNQSSNYEENSTTTNQMNRDLIGDFERILTLPTELGLLNNAVLALQPYVYDNYTQNCGNCGSCNICCREQKFDPEGPYFVTLMARLDDLNRRMSYYEQKKRGPQGERGPSGPQGPIGPPGGKYVPDEKTIIHDETTQTISINPGLIDSVNNRFVELQTLKQNKNDPDLTTTDKTIVGAINEINNKFNSEEIKRIKSILRAAAFGINKNQPDPVLAFENTGFFTERIDYSDLDKPDDNMVTDDQGNPKDIRKIRSSHYSGNTWFDNDGNTTLRDYQGKLTYKGEDIGYNFWEYSNGSIYTVRLKGPNKNIDCNNRPINKVDPPTHDTDATNKQYVDSKINNFSNNLNKQTSDLLISQKVNAVLNFCTTMQRIIYNDDKLGTNLYNTALKMALGKFSVLSEPKKDPKDDIT